MLYPFISTADADNAVICILRDAKCSVDTAMDIESDRGVADRSIEATFYKRNC